MLFLVHRNYEVVTMLSAIKEFEVEEGSLPDMRYKITVKFRGKLVAEFKKDTMLEAQQAFYSAGYKSVAWVEGPRIVLQDR